MNPEVEIRIVVAIAAVLVLVSLALCVFALHHDARRRERVGFAWLFMTNMAFLIATLGLMANPVLPFWASAALVISGAHLGIVFGYFAVCAGLGDPPDLRRYGVLATGAIGGQAALALHLGDIGSLVLTSSVINGAMGLHMARSIWPRARGFGPEIAALASLPFAAIAAAYLFRLPLLAVDAPPTAVTVATLVITFLLAFSALQWAFALIAFRAARLNTRLEAERWRAEEASRLKSRFLANMSHELRTPLNGVLGMAQVLQAELDEGEQQRMVDTIRSSGEGLMSLLNDILDLSTLEAGGLELRLAPFAPSNLADRIVAAHRAEAARKGLAIDCRCAPNLAAEYLGDEARIAQVLNNILCNAVKFTEAGRIDLRIDRAGGGIAIQISDTGIGMSKAQLAGIFDDFAQADVSITRRFGGAGLGMPIARRLIEGMGGRIIVASTPGKGTEVRITLPLEAATSASPSPATTLAEATAPLQEELRILVAEDNRTNQRVLRALLRGSGCELTFADNGRQALAAALGGAFDLFLFDVSMPEMDGPTALREIARAYAAAGRPLPPAAAVTANVSPEQVAGYVDAGFLDCVAKPVKKAALMSCIARLSENGLRRVA